MATDRNKLPRFEHHARVGDVRFFISVVEEESGRPVELFLHDPRAGSAVNGRNEETAREITRRLERSLSVTQAVADLMGIESKDPSGRGNTHYPYISNASSVLDYAARWLALEYGGDASAASDPSRVDVTSLRGYEKGLFKALQN